MKIKNILLTVLSGLLITSFTQTAQATVITPPGFLGHLQIGDSGLSNNFISDFDVTGDLVNDPLFGYATGTIPSNSMITFTYHHIPMSPADSLHSLGSYTMRTPTQGFTYYASSDGINKLVTSSLFTFPNLPVSISDIDPADMPVQAQADLGTGITSVTNLAAAAASFTSYLLAPFGLTGSYNVTYTVTAVPLPAALPLLGVGLLGLAGVARRKKNAA